MFKIPKIEKENFYIDRAMKSMEAFAAKEKLVVDNRFKRVATFQRKSKEDNNLNKRKDLELQKVRHLNSRVNNDVRKLIRTFPNFMKVDKVYLDLINTSETSTSMIKEALNDLKWICDGCDEFTQKSEFKLKTVRSQETMGYIMKKYLGRVNSLFSKSKKAFITLDNARLFMNQLPSFEDLYTVCIAGFPNVGKSTLMKKITGSNVEIQNYPFTTKGLMFSYLYYKEQKAIQIIDTPGLLGRTKNNGIEERAEIVLRDYCQSMVFVIDFTESCGYKVEQQLALLKKVTTDNTPVTLYFSKEDIFNEEDKEKKMEALKTLKKYKFYTDSELIKAFILENYLSKRPKFDPSKLKTIR
ncbi:MAG: 50S ribosome-binding GTPase [Nanoarchaeales archaeon]|nr:50S ribosome-binding GTPase [Nanoarchaeales archaeon]